MKEPSLADQIREDVLRALAEDVGSGDLTAALIPAERIAEAMLIAREPAVLCGTAWFEAVFAEIDARVSVAWDRNDGDVITAGETLCRIRGPARGMLTAERTALNFLQTLSGTATQARRYAEAVHGTAAVVLDTRKTLPGLRVAQKYATRCGGCENHRMGLYDAILIKENHIAAVGSLTAALEQARTQAAGIPIEVEVENLAELREAIAAGATRVLLDNFDTGMMRIAVKETCGRAKLEASGGIGLHNIRTIAETGVNYISIGDITKNVRAIDLSLRFVD